MIDPPKPGIYEHIPFDTYCEWDAVNSSRLKLMGISPAHYKAGWTGDSKAFQLGRLTHAGKLESISIPLRYAVMPEFELNQANITGDNKPSTSKSTKYYKNKVARFIEAKGDRELVSTKVYKEMAELVACIERHPLACEYLNAPGPVEVSIVWVDKETGLTCKGRIDKVTDNAICDLKTSADAMRFSWDLWKFGYHCQAAHYVDGWEALTGEVREFRIVLVAKPEPIAIMAAPFDYESIQIGQIQNRARMRKVLECKHSGEWPNLESPDMWRIPQEKADWVLNNCLEGAVDV